MKVVLDENGIKSLQFVPMIQSGSKTTIASDGEKHRILSYIQSLSPTITVDGQGFIVKR